MRHIFVAKIVILLAVFATQEADGGQASCDGLKSNVAYLEKKIKPGKIGGLYEKLHQCYAGQGNIEEAIFYYKKALSDWEKGSYLPAWMATHYRSYADLLERAGRSKEAKRARATAEKLEAQ